MKISKVFSLIIGALLFIMPSIVFSWSSDTSINTPISLAADDQTSQVITDDGIGGAIIVWMDYRNAGGSSDIYAQYIDATGAAQWTADGRPVCTAADTQSDINIISDGNGGAILAWLDRRSGSNQIYAQRIAGNGTALWALNGVLVADSPDGSPYMGLVSDGAGGVILVWEDLRSGSTANLDVYAQRINKDGIIQWTQGGLPISAGIIQESLPSITSDNTGGAIIVWADARDGSDDVYAQRINASGVSQWTTGGTKIIGDQNERERCVNIVSDDAGGAIVLYSLFPATDSHAQKINANGVPQWTSAALNTSFYPGNTKPMFIKDGLGGAIFSWNTYNSDDQGNDIAIYAQSVDSEGNLRWPAGGLLAGHKLEMSEKASSMVSDTAGGFFTSWTAFDSGSPVIHAQYFNAAGLPQWGTSPIPVGTSSASKWEPVTASDGLGGAIFTWAEWRNGEQQDLYAHKLSASGGSSGLQTPDNLFPVNGAQATAMPTLGASAFIDDQGLLSHAASQWRINNTIAITPESPEYSVSGDDSSFTYDLPFNFLFFGRVITSISVKIDGLIELLEEGETAYPTDGTGTHADDEHINNMDAIFAANDDLDMTKGYLHLYNAGTYITIEWYGATYADGGNVSSYPIHFQVILHQDGTITWNFKELEIFNSEYDLFTGVYSNGGVEIPAYPGSLLNISTPSAYAFNPVTHVISPSTYNWSVPQTVLYDSDETTDLDSHMVPDTAGLEKDAIYYWGVRYKGDNNEWSKWSTPTSFTAIGAQESGDLIDLVVTLQVVTGDTPSGGGDEADVNGDGRIGLAEAIYILQQLAK